MAVIKRGILGGFQNKIANVVGGSWKGISYMRSLPISVANPQTAAQTLQREKFSSVVFFAGIILSQLIKPLWDRFAQYQSGYNAFISANIANFANNQPVLPANLVVSRGTLAKANLTSAVVDASAKSITVNWDSTPAGDANPTDTLFLLFMGTTSLYIEGFNTGVARSVGTATVIADNVGGIGFEYYVYASFRKLDGTKVSDTEYITGEVVA